VADSLVEHNPLVEHNANCRCGWCRLRNGASRGGVSAGATRRARRQRYLDGTMTTAELAVYRRVLDNARRAGRAGGLKSRQQQCEETQ
jgi:hypothetical protein